MRPPKSQNRAGPPHPLPFGRSVSAAFWWVVGPIGPIIDVFFQSSDDYRQMLRDKLMGTYVIRMDAEPAGTGPKTMSRMSFMGMMLMYPIVRPAAGAEPGQAQVSDNRG